MSEAGRRRDRPAATRAGTLLRQAREAAGLHVAALAVVAQGAGAQARGAGRRPLRPAARRRVRARAGLQRLPHAQDRSAAGAGAPAADRPRRGWCGTSTASTRRSARPATARRPAWLDQLTRPVFLAVVRRCCSARWCWSCCPRRQQDDAVTAERDPTPATPGCAPSRARPVDPAAGAGGRRRRSGRHGAGARLPAVAAPRRCRRPRRRRPRRLPPHAAGRAAPAPRRGSRPAASSSSQAKAPSWVEVTDAKGVVAVSASSWQPAKPPALPAHCRCRSPSAGRATEVQVRGKPFDLRPVSRDNVARFEVK